MLMQPRPRAEVASPSRPSVRCFMCWPPSRSLGLMVGSRPVQQRTGLAGKDRLALALYSAGMNELEVRELRYFVAVAQELNFSRAAARLGMAQPPLSKAIRQLEAKLGVRLLERTTRRVTLTEAGQVLLEQARGAIDAVGAAARRAQRAGRRVLGWPRPGLPGGILARQAPCARAPGRRPRATAGGRRAGTGGRLPAGLARQAAPTRRCRLPSGRGAQPDHAGGRLAADVPLAGRGRLRPRRRPGRDRPAPAGDGPAVAGRRGLPEAQPRASGSSPPTS